MTLTKTLTNAFNYYFKRINTVILCEVVKIRGNNVDLQPLIRGKLKDNLNNITNYDLPVLLDIPVLTLQAGGFSVRMPIKVGDQGLALVSQRDIRNWKNNRTISNQQTTRKFNINDSFYLGAILPSDKSNATDGIYLYNDSDLYFSVKSDKVETNLDIYCKQIFATNILASGTIGATGTTGSGVVTAKNIITDGVGSLNTHTHSGVQTGGGNTGEPN